MIKDVFACEPGDFRQGFPEFILYQQPRTTSSVMSGDQKLCFLKQFSQETWEPDHEDAR